MLFSQFDILPQLLINSLIIGSIYALASSGLSLVYGLLRILNFAHGHILMTGAYIFYFFSVELEYSILFSGFITIVSTIILSILAMKIFIAPFLKYSVLLALVSTLSLSIILESSISMIFGVNVKSLRIENFSESYEFYGVYITQLQIIILLSALVLLSLLALFIHKTIPGRFIRALSENPHSGQALGINKDIIFYGIFILGSVMAAFAGIMIAYETNLQPLMGNSFTIKAFATMILGGLGNFWGTIAGSYILGLTENLSIGLDWFGYTLPAGYKDAFAFVIILIILIFKPNGLFRKGTRRA